MAQVMKKQFDVQCIHFKFIYFRPVTCVNCTIVLQDHANNVADRRSVETTFNIKIEDGDDLGPVFSYPTCNQIRGNCLDAAYVATVVTGTNVSTAIYVKLLYNSSLMHYGDTAVFLFCFMTHTLGWQCLIIDSIE